MKKYKKYWYYLSFALSISLTIIVINNVNDTAIPKIVQDINSGVIGAILTTIITLLLLSNQTESQENLTKSSVVYEEKLKIFNKFLETVFRCLEDGKLSSGEIVEIIHSFSLLRIHISPESSQKLEETIMSIDNSFFYVDENNTPNLKRYIKLYTDMTNVFRKELYGDKAHTALNDFNFNNFAEILFMKRTVDIKPLNFNELIELLKSHNKLLYRNPKTENTTVYDIDSNLIECLTIFHDFLEKIVKSISEEITFSFEIKKHIINKEIYVGLPYVKLSYKKHYFAHFGISEKKRLFIGTKNPNSKQIAAIETYEIEKLNALKTQISNEIKHCIQQLSNEKHD
jgi:hypothetical protein